MTLEQPRKESDDDLRVVRMGKGLKQSEVATLAGTSQCAVSEIEAGKRNVCLSTLDKIARPLDFMVTLGEPSDFRLVAYHETTTVANGSSGACWVASPQSGDDQ
jgi:transcriptional regulator with XRE-family HTH domain